MPISNRKCWYCKKKEHTRSACPERKKVGAALKSVEPGEEPAPSLAKVVFVVDRNGFTKVGNRRKPIKTKLALGDYLTKDFLRGLNAVSVTNHDTSGAPCCV